MTSHNTMEMPMVQKMAATDSEAPASALAGPDFFEGYVTESDYAERRGVSVRTCQRDRQLRRSPPFVVVGRHIYYRVEAIRDWLIARERSGERRPAASRAGRRRRAQPHTGAPCRRNERRRLDERLLSVRKRRTVRPRPHGPRAARPRQMT